MNTSADLRFAPSHEWLRPDGRVGISDHAQAELTDVVYVELPKVGTAVKAGQPVCVVESVKAASDIYAPATGIVTAVNEDLPGNPGLINTDPYGAGWIFQLELAQPEETNGLVSAEDYRAQFGSA